jgi:hypothetical protein
MRTQVALESMAAANMRAGTRAADAIPIFRDFSHQAQRARLAYLEPRFPHPMARVIGLRIESMQARPARLP